jgi:hypothetical protein
MKTVRTISLLSIATFALSLASFAATPGTDNADESAYQAGWLSGSNGGVGFKGWNLVLAGQGDAGGFFIGDSKKTGAADINTNSRAFGMFGHDKAKSTDAYRSFDSPLEVGQSFSVEIQANFRDGNKGFDLRGIDDKTLFNFNIGADDYVVHLAATGAGSVGNDYSNNTVFKLVFTQTGVADGTWSLTRSGGFSKTLNGTYSGVAAGFKFYAAGTTDVPENDLSFNNLVITGKK